VSDVEAPHARSTRGPAQPSEYRLEDQFGAAAGRVTMSGVHALLRAPLDTVRDDARRGRHTGGVVCGYRGSPLGTVDTTFSANEIEFAAHDIQFVNGVNEDLAATVLWGTQRVQQEPTSTVDGVIGLWYGKAPGLDRSGDALRHANLSGVPPTGGVLAAVGDDPECKSSTVPSSTEWTLADLAMPALSAASVQDVLDLGRHGYEISRRSGSWVGLKLHSDIADGYATVDVGRALPVVPRFERDGQPWSAHLDDRMFAPWSMLLEEEATGIRLDAVHHYVRNAGIDVVHGRGPARVGILAAGKTYGDMVTALADLGVTLHDLEGLGIRILKPALVWPLEPTIVRSFAAGLAEIVVVEEKRAFLEDQVKSLLYGTPDAPVISGKRDPNGATLVAAGGVLDVTGVAGALRRRLEVHVDEARLRPVRARITLAADLPARTPYFCSGCPHNRSTVVPEGSVAGGGIGCHGMALFTRDRATGTTQMGGEGAQWVGASLFSSEAHRFQNIGDGTLAHSGFLAVRQAVAAGTTVTFKILANGVVAMTGGQHAAGSLSIPALTRQLEAEGVRRIDVISEEAGRYGPSPGFAPGVRVHGRKELDRVQRELREVAGVTALIYDQACAAELRRERKRGRAETPATRVMINQAVCEGCGNCGDVSNCLSVHPVDTPFGRKTHIHQDSCNIDMSCLEGDCPAFVTVTPKDGTTKDGRRPRARGKARRKDRAKATPLPEPTRPERAALLVAGIGGTGVVTVGQVLSTAANLDGLEVASVDQTGMAQKGGPVVSHLRIGPGATEGAARLEEASADAFLVFDLLTGVAPANLARLDPARTTAVVSTTQVPTGAMVADVGREDFPDIATLGRRVDERTRHQVYLDAEAVALDAFGSQPAANLVVVGVAYQHGLLPQSASSIERAIELNGVAVEMNTAAFRLGREIAVDPSLAATAARPAPPPLDARAAALCALVDADEALREVLAWRVPELVAYQDVEYAQRFVDVVARARRAELAAGTTSSDFSITVARNLFHLMAYKDEYEVARLHRQVAFRDEVTGEFGPGADVTFHLQPPVASKLGLQRKIPLSSRTAGAAFWGLTKMTKLRGTRFDPFGRSAERRDERRLIEEYVALVDRLAVHLGTPAAADAVRVAGLVDMVRGFAAVKQRNLERYRAELPLALADLTRSEP
jgi:indolepyruvate ferredoxin oxidoreductase